MRRRQTGTSMPAAASNSVSPSSTMRPRSGASSPLIMLMMLVLPAPDGPNNAVAPPSLSKAARSTKSPSCFPTSTDNISRPMKPRGGAPRKPFRRQQRAKRNDDRDDDQLEGGGVAARHLRQRVIAAEMVCVSPGMLE